MAAVTCVYTIRYVAERLGLSEDEISDIAMTDMDPEHGHLWIYDTGGIETEAFTDDGIDHLAELIANRATWLNDKG
ncbi:hypothetical protein BSL82_10405 [Tardibacter chloracetimidivorans]|uniref:Uncharacterized protein n=1 Tax=Tardibacter chloracetimidivorans TaxID=1921510 RepID=A0A1L3ZVS2_9SPHN|nr:hypothetical protein [Tardibacter chloracetimidivorans]API59679.1 hypothetical protein BSL82_10405 [Tardibacter chloracetimidivorans]